MGEVGAMLEPLWEPAGSAPGDDSGFGLRDLARAAVREVDKGKVKVLFDDFFAQAATDADAWRGDPDAEPPNWAALVTEAYAKLDKLAGEQDADDAYARNRQREREAAATGSPAKRLSAALADDESEQPAK
eukprot:569051-Prymnesium_polylepis.1